MDIYLIVMISKLNILINPCTKNNKLFDIVEARVESSGIGFQFITYFFILNSKTRKEKGILKSDLTKANTKNKKASKFKSNQI